jgi:predicted transcriptional regulator
MSESLDQETQNKIQELIKKAPGLYISKIAQLLTINISDVQIHLQTLEKSGSIIAVEEKGSKRYYLQERQPQLRDQRNLTIRNEIYTLIEKNPGLYLSKIAELLGMSIQLADYHLSYMQRNNDIIVRKKPGEYLRKYYTFDAQIGDQDNKLLQVVTKKIPLEIILFLLKKESAPHKEIYENLGISPSKLSYHITKLMQIGVIYAQSFGDEKGYLLKNKTEIIRFLKKHRLRIEMDLAVDEFLDVWDNFNYGE